MTSFLQVSVFIIYKMGVIMETWIYSFQTYLNDQINVVEERERRRHIEKHLESNTNKSQRWTSEYDICQKGRRQEWSQVSAWIPQKRWWITWTKEAEKRQVGEECESGTFWWRQQWKATYVLQPLLFWRRVLEIQIWKSRAHKLTRKPSHVHWVTPERIFQQKLQTSGPWTTSGTQTCFVWPPQSSKKSFSQHTKILWLQLF